MADITLENAAQKFRDVGSRLDYLVEATMTAIEEGTATTNLGIELRAAEDERKRLQDWILAHMPEFFD